MFDITNVAYYYNQLDLVNYLIYNHELYLSDKVIEHYKNSEMEIISGFFKNFFDDVDYYKNNQDSSKERYGEGSRYHNMLIDILKYIIDKRYHKIIRYIVLKYKNDDLEYNSINRFIDQIKTLEAEGKNTFACTIQMQVSEPNGDIRTDKHILNDIFNHLADIGIYMSMQYPDGDIIPFYAAKPTKEEEVKYKEIEEFKNTLNNAIKEFSRSAEEFLQKHSEEFVNKIMEEIDTGIKNEKSKKES